MQVKLLFSAAFPKTCCSNDRAQIDIVRMIVRAIFVAINLNVLSFLGFSFPCTLNWLRLKSLLTSQDSRMRCLFRENEKKQRKPTITSM